MTSRFGIAAVVRSKRHGLPAGALFLTALLPAGASARIVEVKVDARAAPWDRRSNPRLSFGSGDGQRPKMVFGAPSFGGIKVTFRASGSVEWIGGGT